VQCRFKVGAIDAAALGPFMKQAQMKTNENFQDLQSYTHRDITSKNSGNAALLQ